jgi:hypothetical protein
MSGRVGGAPGKRDTAACASTGGSTLIVMMGVGVSATSVFSIGGFVVGPSIGTSDGRVTSSSGIRKE